jgi:hypothetical protein
MTRVLVHTISCMIMFAVALPSRRMLATMAKALGLQAQPMAALTLLGVVTGLAVPMQAAGNLVGRW